MSKENREIWLHELEPATWLARALTDLGVEFEKRFGRENPSSVPYYIDGPVYLVHEGWRAGKLVPNDVEEWAYQPLDDDEAVT